MTRMCYRLVQTVKLLSFVWIKPHQHDTILTSPKYTHLTSQTCRNVRKKNIQKGLFWFVFLVENVYVALHCGIYSTYRKTKVEPVRLAVKDSASALFYRQEKCHANGSYPLRGFRKRYFSFFAGRPGHKKCCMILYAVRVLICPRMLYISGS